MNLPTPNYPFPYLQSYKLHQFAKILLNKSLPTSVIGYWNQGYDVDLEHIILPFKLLI